MNAPIHSFSVPLFDRMLNNLSALLDKAEAHAAARKIEPSVLLNSRLFPDMFALTRQVQLSCDFAKNATARLLGEEPPKWEDSETSFAELKARIARTREFIGSFAADRFAGVESRTVTVPFRGEQRTMTGLAYLTNAVLPNFFFHLTTAYDILRKDGVELGKRDFIGNY